jgi:hypothetical protein
MYTAHKVDSPNPLPVVENFQISVWLASYMRMVIRTTTLKSQIVLGGFGKVLSTNQMDAQL